MTNDELLNMCKTASEAYAHNLLSQFIMEEYGEDVTQMREQNERPLKMFRRTVNLAVTQKKENDERTN